MKRLNNDSSVWKYIIYNQTNQWSDNYIYTPYTGYTAVLQWCNLVCRVRIRPSDKNAFAKQNLQWLLDNMKIFNEVSKSMAFAGNEFVRTGIFGIFGDGQVI